MTSLDNFNTGNGTTKPFYPSTLERMNSIGLGVNHSRSWDVPTSTPVVALSIDADHHPRSLSMVTDHWENKYKDLFVPSYPHTFKIHGDNVESMLLVPGGHNPLKSWWNKWAGTSSSKLNTQAIRSRPY